MFNFINTDISFSISNEFEFKALKKSLPKNYNYKILHRTLGNISIIQDPYTRCHTVLYFFNMVNTSYSRYSKNKSFISLNNSILLTISNCLIETVPRCSASLNLKFLLSIRNKLNKTPILLDYLFTKGGYVNLSSEADYISFLYCLGDKDKTADTVNSTFSKYCLSTNRRYSKVDFEYIKNSKDKFYDLFPELLG